MLHAIIVRDPEVLSHILEYTGAKRVPLPGLPYQIFSQGNIRIIGEYETSATEVLASVMREFNPDTVFFLSGSYPVSDEKLPGDIILPNVFFRYDRGIESMEIGNDPMKSLQSHPIFLEHYPLQGDYNFESFGFSVGGIHVSGDWNAELEDFRIRLRVAYENDTFDSDLYDFVEAAQKQGIAEKTYPVAYIGTEDKAAGARNLWSIIRFIVGSIDPDIVSDEGETDE